MLSIFYQLTHNQIIITLVFLGIASLGLYLINRYRDELTYRVDKPILWLMLLMVFFSFAYLSNLDSYQINDDEGGYLYGSWRIYNNEIPYRDFMSPQMPLFLYTGAALFNYFEPGLYVVRLYSTLLILISALFLYHIGKEIFDSDTGLFALTIFSSNYLIFNHSRTFRADPIMLAIDIIALYFLVRGEKNDKWYYFLIAGLTWGMATSYKLFGIFPLFGVGLFWLYQLFRGDITFGKLIKKSVLTIIGIAIVPFVSLGGIYLLVPDLYEFLVGHHLKQGSGWSAFQVFTKSMTFLIKYIIHNQILCALSTLGIYSVISNKQRDKSEISLILVFLPVCILLFFILPRPGYNRHMMFLIPVFSLLMSRGLLLMFSWQRERWRSLAFALFAVYFLTNLGINWQRGLKKENKTQELARIIQQYVEPHEYIVADYASLAFHSRRRMPPHISGASRGSITGGQTTVDDYLENIEKYQVKMIIMQNDGHGTIQMLPGIQRLRRVLKEKYQILIPSFKREKETFDIYLRLTP